MIKFDKVSKTFGLGTFGLGDISFFIEKGEFVFVVGQTGSGKTTLFRLLIHDMIATKGSIIVGEFDVTKMPHGKIPHLRKKIGVVFQDLKLLMDRTIFENVLLPLDVAGVKVEDAKKRVDEILLQVGISAHRDKFPIQLSGGERQRAAIARALVFAPDILLADEPTGNLDPTTGQEVVKLLQGINEKGTTIIMATHNIDIVNSLGKRVVALDKGRVIRDQKKGKYAAS